MKIPNSPTASMGIDILSFKDSKNLLTDCKTLAGIKEIADYLKKPASDNKIVLYIVLLYSSDSILNRKPVEGLEQRKRKAADLVEFKTLKDGKFVAKVEESLFQLGDENIIDMIFGLLRFQNDSLWMEIVATESMIDQYVKGMLKRIDIDDEKKGIDALEKKSKLRQEVRSMNKDLKIMYSDFYRDHEDLKEKTKSMVRSNSIESRVMANA
jgi:hypothetical protein